MKMTGGQALVQSLKRAELDTLFLLPGIQLDFAVDALWEVRDSFTLIHTRHEQATSYMADGYARSTGKIGVCMVVPGPGVLNAAAGLSTAYACSSPVLCISGQIDSHLIGKGHGILHEINGQAQAMSAVVKHTECAMRAQDIPGMVGRAVEALNTGRPRPVEIELPLDVLETTTDIELLSPPEISRAQDRPVDIDAIKAAAALLGAAREPVICCGGGVLSAAAWEEVGELAEMLEAPVLMTANGRGVLSDRDYRAHSGSVAARALLPSADVVLAVGTRFMPSPSPYGRPQFAPDAKLIQIDIDGTELGRNRPNTLGIEGDAKAALGVLINELGRRNSRRTPRQDSLREIQGQTRARFSRDPLLESYGMAIRAELPDDGLLISESTQVGYWCNAGGFPVYQPRTFFTSGYQGTLGYGFATALGAQVGNPGKKVVSINGDGGFMYNVQELSTMAHYNIPVVTIVFNDNAFGNVRRIQTLRFNGHTLATELRNPDLPKLAELFGVAGYRARDAAELRDTLRHALAADRPALIEVPMPPSAELIGVFSHQQEPPRPKLES